MAPAVASIWASSAHGRCELVVGGKPTSSQADDLHSFIKLHCGEDAANLFAKPVTGVDNKTTWVDRLGATESVPLSQAPSEQRAALDEKLRAHLAKIEPLAADDKYGALVLAALEVESPDAIRVAAGRPIIAGWGGIPIDVTTEEAMRVHHADTLGPYLTSIDPPIPTPDAGAKSVPPATSATAGATWSAANFRIPLIACIIAAIALLLLLLPGVLLRTAPTIALSVAPPFDNSAANLALEQQIVALQAQLGANVCVLGGQTMPRLEPIGPRSVERSPASTVPNVPTAIVPSESRGVPAARSTVDANRSSTPPDSSATPGTPLALGPSTPPVPPASTPVPSEVVPPAQSGGPQSLADLVNKATVLVLTEDGNGTGFFISPNLVLTNRHVIEGSNVIKVGNKALGRMVDAEVLTSSPAGRAGEPDFALIRLREGMSPTFLSMATDLPQALQNVIAAGFPGIILRDDAAFLRLRRNNDMTSVPETALTAGQVVQIQRSDSTAPIIVHRASISPGNSGGPLVDECGRIVGINTYVLPAGARQRPGGPPDASDRMHYAQSTNSAVRFLQQNNVTVRIVSGRCVVGAPTATAPTGVARESLGRENDNLAPGSQTTAPPSGQAR